MLCFSLQAGGGNWMQSEVSIHAVMQPRYRGITTAHTLLRRFPGIKIVNPTCYAQYGLVRLNLLNYSEIN